MATVLFILYCLEAGAFFVIAPWTEFWSVHPLLHATPWLGAIFDSFHTRGLVSGFGLAHLMLGMREIWRVAGRRLAGRAQEIGKGSP